jgi:hypothetical protein
VFSHSGISRYKRGMTTRKPEPNKQARPTPPLAEKQAAKPSQADEAHIATAEYWRDQQVAIDRIAKLKALRLAQGAKPKRKKKTPSLFDRPKTSRSRRWGT